MVLEKNMKAITHKRKRFCFGYILFFPIVVHCVYLPLFKVCFATWIISRTIFWWQSWKKHTAISDTTKRQPKNKVSYSNYLFIYVRSIEIMGLGWRQKMLKNDCECPSSSWYNAMYGAPFVKILYLTDLAQKLLSLRIFSYLCAEITISAHI